VTDHDNPDQTPGPPVKIPDRADQIVSMLQIRFACPRCGKRCYASRKAARKAARLLRPGTHMRKYSCGGYWHLTSMREKPAPRRQGRQARQQDRLALPTAA
jgi:ribosomal protein L33